MNGLVVPVGVIAGIFLQAVDKGASDYWLDDVRVNKCTNKDYDIKSKVFGDPRLYMGEFELEVDGGGVTNTVDNRDLERALAVMRVKYSDKLEDILSQGITSDTADLFFQLCVFGAKIYD